MNSPKWTCVLFVLLAGLAGCTSAPPSPVPVAAQVVKIDVRVTRFPPGAAAKAPCAAAVVQPGPIAGLTGWLQAIDWSQEGIDLKAARPTEPDGALAITTKGGAVKDFSFYWDGRVIDHGGNRLLPGGDGGKLLKIVEGVCP